MFEAVVEFIRSVYSYRDVIPLHEPKFAGKEKEYLLDCIDSTFVSSVGAYVDRFETMVSEITGAKYAVATVNGTAALHIALKLAGVGQGDEVITQPLSFVATANAISCCGAKPVFLDVDLNTLGLSSKSLENFLKTGTKFENGICYNNSTGKRISACVPMHTFGFACQIDKITDICREYGVKVVEDAAESLGSSYKGKHTGTFGDLGIYSLNGNKTVTCGGGGAIVTDNQELAKKAKHLTTTGKVPHQYEYVHDMIAYNYRMPNLNAALACAQLEQLDDFVEKKRVLAAKYSDFFEDTDIKFFEEPKDTRSNYWLNTLIMTDAERKNAFLSETNKAGIMTRPAWRLLNKLDMYKDCQTDDLTNSKWLEERIVNIPSSVIL